MAEEELRGTTPQQEDDNEQMQIRKEKLAALQAAGQDPFHFLQRH